MAFIKELNRKILLPVIRITNLDKQISKLSRNKNLILNYHGVVKDYDATLSKNHMAIDQFEEQMIYFKKNFEILSIENIVKRNQNANEASKHMSLAITFDDGYLNNYENAFPILNSLKIPATIYVTGQSITKPSAPLWYDMLDILNSQITWTKLKPEVRPLFDDLQNSNVFNDYSSFKNYIKTTRPSVKNKLLTLLEINPFIKNSFQNCNKEYWQLMGNQELKFISKDNLIEIGSHGLTHSNLDMLNEQDLKAELLKSKKLLEEAIGKEITSIAFPDGAYNEKVKEECRHIYRSMLAVNLKNQNERSQIDIFPRLSISNTTTSQSVIVKTNLSFSRTGF